MFHYGIRAGDRVVMIDQHRQPGTERVENGARGEVIDVSETGEALIQFDATSQWRTLASDDLARLRLGYASHIHRAQGATVTRTLVVTGGWQTSKEPAYVEASRAREGTDWYVNRPGRAFGLEAPYVPQQLPACVDADRLLGEMRKQVELAPAQLNRPVVVVGCARPRIYVEPHMGEPTGARKLARPRGTLSARPRVPRPVADQK